MKKSFTLLITILLLVIFSLVSLQILQTKAIKSQNISNQFLYIQAKNHLDFLEEYILSIDLKDIDSIKISDDFFLINAVKSQDEKYINLYVEAYDFNIRATKRLLIK